MTRDVLARKIARIKTLLADLQPHAGKSVDAVLEDHYEIERLLELLVQVAVDPVSHDLAEREVVPDSYREAFLQAARHGILPADLADDLADAAGLRNVLVHLYDSIDYEIVAASVDRALKDFGRFVQVYSERLGEDNDAHDT